jgi:hypothetical protein
MITFCGATLYSYNNLEKEPSCAYNRPSDFYEVCPESICLFGISREPVGGLDIIWQPVRGNLEQSLSRGASQSAVRRLWLTFCTVWHSHSQSSASMSVLGTARSCREPNLSCRGANRPGLCEVLKKERKRICIKSEEWAGALSWSRQSPLANNSGRFLLITSYSRRRTWRSTPYLLSGLEERTRGG